MTLTAPHSNAIGAMDLFPGIAAPLPDGRWRIQVMGQVRKPYQPTIRKRLLIRLLTNLMHATEEEIDSPLFRSRVEPFVSDGWSGVELVCHIGGREIPLARPTKRNGHFGGWVVVDSATADRAQRGDLNGSWICYEIRPRDVAREFPDLVGSGQALALNPAGCSVVSDVDDTIKETVISERRQLLANTFLREFREIEGMSALYRNWLQFGASFHYVSSSPWQLFGPLWQMLSSSQFPLGSIHLRSFRLRNHVLQRMIRIRRSGKPRAIAELIRSIPGRQFVLVGDSGEKDLEIYAKVAVRCPSQVRAIFIRNLPGHEVSERRLERAVRRISGVHCETFEDASQLDKLSRSVFEPE